MIRSFGIALLLLSFAAAAPRAQVVPLPSEARGVLQNHAAGVSPAGMGPGNTPILSGPVDPATYRLGPGDQLSVEMWGRVTNSLKLEVGPQGVLSLPVGGMLDVGGMTLSQARALILERWRREYRDVQIDVVLARPRTFRLTLAGEVDRPGPVEAMGSTRVGDLVLPEMLKDGASRRNIEVVHRDGTRQRADIDRLLRIGDGSRNPVLSDGDVIVVPRAREWIEIAGAVAAPGRYERAADDSVSTIFRLAGGALPAAAADAVLWIHWANDAAPDSVRLSLAQVRDGAGARPLGNGDRLYVYFTPNYRMQQQVTLEGEFVRPGTYPIQEGVTHFSDVVRAAGGFLPEANLSAIRVRGARDAGESKDPELERLLRMSRGELTATEYAILRTKLAASRAEYRVDWSRLNRSPEALDLPLHDDDVIVADRLVSTIRVDGEVLRPAIESYRAGMSVNEYIARAGGFSNRALRGKVRVTRAVSGQTLLARDVPELGPGDFIWVPEKADVTAWQQAKEVLSALAAVATIVIAIRSVR